ncbi:hypothetical protein CK203_012863 [Vitis vinifera]|uniref:F-box domain-containing protein n=1 Tax=Vitis vinifera TaxID=29760 RepID=A0A438JM83_VITVI|nr:hypothetical protein CK203_012863 [Vitis vinifera]
MALPRSDWASLPINLLDLILNYLVPMEDYLRFSEVCIEWQYAVREKLQHLRSNHKRHCRLHQKVPLLMAPTTDNTRERCCLYDVMTGKSLWEFQLRLGRSKCEGSSHGWLILVEDDSYKESFPSSRRRSVLCIDPDVNRDEFVLMMTCDGLIRRVAFINQEKKTGLILKGCRM